MKIIFLTPGTGGWYCGACMRDNMLAKSLQAAGHHVALLPMYLPLFLDEEVVAGSVARPVVFGGVNLYLQRKSAMFRWLSSWFGGLLNHPRLLRWVALRSHMTSARELGEMTLAMLRFEEPAMLVEMDQLCDLLDKEHPDVICLSTALQAGMIRQLKHRTHARIICCFQGEDSFLDHLPLPWRDDCWRELAHRTTEADALVAPSEFYAELMRRRLNHGALIQVIPNGIFTSDYQPLLEKPQPPVIGFLARMSHEKGLDLMVDAFIHLRVVLGHPNAVLHVAGAATAENAPLIATLKARLHRAGLTASVRWSPNISRADKLVMLRGLSLFSVPAVYPEAFGLYVIEAMAAGVVVVQPRASAFPELLDSPPVGVLVPPADCHALAQAWFDMLAHPDDLARMACLSRDAAVSRFDATIMREAFVALARQLMGKN